tara:strand:+ start:2890 stop:4407 length:1518 start_codon:yes stop_codon:yes gene_type:complete
MIKKIIWGLSLLGSVCAYGQTVSGFENVISKVDSSYNGNKKDQGVVSGAGHFWNSYNSKYGSWNGFSFSSKTDTVIGKWSNQYSSISGNGANNSMSYAVAYSSAQITFTESIIGDSIYGFSLNNSTYAYKTIRDGNVFSKKFGGASGNDTDFFRVIIKGYQDGNKTSEVVFYLADYRFSDNTKDYIVNDWSWINLKSLGRVDEVNLNFESTDMGQFGINTPTYVCLDSLVYLNSSNKFRPVAEDDQFLSAFDGIANSYKVLTNDKDPDGSLIVTNMNIISPFKQGTSKVKTDGTIQLIQNTNAYGWDTCWYSITDVDLLSDTAEFVLLINKAPDAVNDTFTIVKNTSDTLQILKNDEDEAMDFLKISIRKMPSKGNVLITSTGKLVYTASESIGMDTIRYRITDEYGLVDSAEVYINLDIENGVKQNTNNLIFSVYPNPTQDIIHIKMQNLTEKSFSLSDMSGRTILSGNLPSSGEILVSEFPRGLYILTLRDGNEQAFQKIMIN